MKKLKLYMFFLLVVTVVGVGLFIGSQRGWVDLNQVAKQVGAEKYFESGSDAQNQMSTFTERGQVAGTEIQRVLGKMVQVNEDDKKKPHERALEEAQYVYCKQVVSQYEEDTATHLAE